MYEAQQIFGRANRLSRPEKAVILGFIAGSRENPYPNRGNIIEVTYCPPFVNIFLTFLL